MVSKKDFNSAELETMKIEESDDGDDNGEVQTREDATVCQVIGFIRECYAS